MKDTSLQASTCLRGGLGSGEKVVIVSFRKDGTEVRAGVNHLTGDAQEEPGSAGRASGWWYEQKPPLQLPSPTARVSV